MEVWIFAIVSHRGAGGLWGATMDGETAVVGLALCVAVVATEDRPGNEVWLNRLAPKLTPINQIYAHPSD